MDKRKNTDFAQTEKISVAYFHEQSILRKKLDQFQREQDKSLKKISSRQNTLARDFLAQNVRSENEKATVMEHWQRRSSRTNPFSSYDSVSAESSYLPEIHGRVRKVSAPSDTRSKSSRASLFSDINSDRKVSDPEDLSGRKTDYGERQAVSVPRRKLTPFDIDLAASSGDPHHYSVNSNSRIDNSNTFSQSRSSGSLLNAKIPSGKSAGSLNDHLSCTKSEAEYSMTKKNLPTGLSLCIDAPSRMVNETTSENISKYRRDNLPSVPKKVLENRRQILNGNWTRFQSHPNDIDINIKSQGKEENKNIPRVAPGTSIANGQFQKAGLNVSGGHISGEFSTLELEEADLSRGISNIYLEKEVEVETSRESSNTFQRKGSLSRAQRKLDLHELTIATTTAAGARGGLHHHGNAWSDKSMTSRRKISTVQAPPGRAINRNSRISRYEESFKEQNSTKSETGENIDGLRSFRPLALVAIAAQRFRSATTKASPENPKTGISPDKKILTKVRLEELQRPTESYLRQVAGAEETTTNTLGLRTRSKSENGSSSGNVSVNGITNLRRVSQAALATRVLVDRGSRKVSATGLSELESRQETNQGKSLSDMMNELRNCRYLRNSSHDDK